MDAISLLNYRFSDGDGTLYRGAKASTYFSPTGEELRAAYYKIPIIYTPRVYQEPAEDFQKIGSNYYGAPVYLYSGGSLTRFFHLTAITGGQQLPGGRYLFNVEGTDLPGLCAQYEHAGGIYSGAYFGTILSSILKSTDWYSDGHGKIYVVLPGSGYIMPCVVVDESLYWSRRTGWLPYTHKAIDNLRTLLQSAGAIITTTTTEPNVAPGVMRDPALYITASPESDLPVISPYKTYIEDEYVSSGKVSSVSVVEHTYLALSDVESDVLYEENGTASRKKIIFNEPYHSLAATGLTINERGANYAIVSGGPGNLTGKPYVDATRLLTEVLSTSAGDSVVVDNTLADSLQSQGLLDRVVNYYQNAEDLKSDFTAGDLIEAGKPVTVNDPLNNDVTGYIREQDAVFSGITKLSNRIAVGWNPISGSIFTKRVVMTESGTINVPAGATRMRLILIQGGAGGFGGYNGSAGSNTQVYVAGDGGSPGEGGGPGMVNEVNVAGSDLAASYTVTVGAPGSPGASGHGAGTNGTHSTATDGTTSWSSSEGAAPEYGYVDPMTGDIYAVTGPQGVYSGKPGVGGNHAAESLSDEETGITGTTTWNAGATYSGTSAAGGGGAAYGNNGGNATVNEAGDGANAVLDGFNGYTAPIPRYGCGGIGGNGGGGGGGIRNLEYGWAGNGGLGSPGGPGGAGVVIALFAFGSTPPTPVDTGLLDAHGEPLYDFYFERLKAREE